MVSDVERSVSMLELGVFARDKFLVYDKTTRRAPAGEQYGVCIGQYLGTIIPIKGKLLELSGVVI